MKRTILFGALLVLSHAAAAQYRWVDANGRVQYGDTPPPGAKITTVRPAGSPGSSASSEDPKKAPLTTAEKDAEFRKRQEEGAKQRDKQAQAEKASAEKRENCARAKENMRVLETGRVSRVDGKGERYFLDDTQIAQETARARQLVQEWCS